MGQTGTWSTVECNVEGCHLDRSIPPRAGPSVGSGQGISIYGRNGNAFAHILVSRGTIHLLVVNIERNFGHIP